MYKNRLIIDLFAGGGGVSVGIKQALGVDPDIAVNHDKIAIAMHMQNFPNTKHFQEDIWGVDPLKATEGKPVLLLHGSPDCTHFSRAKGSKPVSKKIRGLAWVLLRWAAITHPDVITMENVPEFVTWGPLRRGRPIKSKSGQTFKKFVDQMQGLGYTVEYRNLIAADYGAPTTRKRFFLIARRDGKPIVWPEPTHCKREQCAILGLKPWRSAAECIDWSLPCPSIFERKKSLSQATMKRIARGLKKFVMENPEPFIVPIGYGESPHQEPRLHDIKNPLPTIVAGGCKHYLISPHLMQMNYQNKPQSLTEPLTTVVSVNHHYLCAPLLLPMGYPDHDGQRTADITEPVPTITAGGGKNGLASITLAPWIEQHYSKGSGSVVSDPLPTVVGVNKNYQCAAFLIQNFGGGYRGAGKALEDPLPTVTAVDHSSLVNAFLVSYYQGENHSGSLCEPLGTVTTKDRFGLVRIDKHDYKIVDIGMRMLQPKELYKAQGFPDWYVYDRTEFGGFITKTEQIAKCGNSVPPPFAKALAEANCL